MAFDSALMFSPVFPTGAYLVVPMIFLILTGGYSKNFESMIPAISNIFKVYELKVL